MPRAVKLVSGDNITRVVGAVCCFFKPGGRFAHVLPDDFTRLDDITEVVEPHQLHIAGGVEKAAGMADIAPEHQVVAIVGNKAADAALAGGQRVTDGGLESLTEEMEGHDYQNGSKQVFGALRTQSKKVHR